MIISRLVKISNVFSSIRQKLPRRLMNQQKKRQKIFNREELDIVYNPLQALQLMRLHSFVSFKQSVQICVRLNVNPKHGEQIVRGTANLPAGLGKSVKIAVLCSKDQYEQLIKKQIEVDFHIKQQNLKEFQKGAPILFEKLFTTPSHIPKLKPYGKLLGPKGLMPNAKLGTLVLLEELPQALKQAKAGQVSYRVDKGKNIHAQIGKLDFTDDQLLQNWRQIMKSLVQKRPSMLKGKYFLQAYLKSTMGPRWKINLLDIDPRNEKSLWSLLSEESASKQSEQIK